VPSWVSERFELTSHVVMVRTDVFHYAYKIYESKELYIPGGSGWWQCLVSRVPAWVVIVRARCGCDACCVVCYP
jgi:hypothetical protein